MHDSLQPLIDRAFHRARAQDANAAIAEVREREGEKSQSYELVVGPDVTLAALAGERLPRLVYHLESRNVRPPDYAGVFLSLFLGDALCFVRARDAIPLLAGALGLKVDELEQRFGTGELRRPMRPDELVATRNQGPTLALPASTGPKK